MEDEEEILAAGARVALRLPLEQDRAAFTALVLASREFLSRWAPGTAVEADPDGSLWFDATLAATAGGGGRAPPRGGGVPPPRGAHAGGRSQKLLIVERESGVLLGMLNFNEIVRGLFQSSFLGYWIGAAYARQGLMGEALAVGLSYAFGPLGLHRVEANIQPGNEPSIALVRRAGFVREGFSERYLKIGGAWRDHERWALTQEAWEATGV